MTRLTKEELEAIRKRVDAATPGPWFWLDDGRLYSDGANKVIGEVIEGKDETWFDIFDTNAEFIAHAREDVPKLLSLVECQKAELERLNDLLNNASEITKQLIDEKHYYMDELRKANAEIERYKEANAE